MVGTPCMLNLAHSSLCSSQLTLAKWIWSTPGVESVAVCSSLAALLKMGAIFLQWAHLCCSNGEVDDEWWWSQHHWLSSWSNKDTSPLSTTSTTTMRTSQTRVSRTSRSRCPPAKSGSQSLQGTTVLQNPHVGGAPQLWKKKEEEEEEEVEARQEEQIWSQQPSPLLLVVL